MSASPKAMAGSMLALVAAMAAGAGMQRAASSSAEPIALRLLGDGQLAIAIEATSCKPKPGGGETCTGPIGRELVCDPDGGHPRINGKASLDLAAEQICQASAAWARTTKPPVATLADRLLRP